METVADLMAALKAAIAFRKDPNMKQLRDKIKGIIETDGEGLLNIDSQDLDEEAVDGMTSAIMQAVQESVFVRENKWMYRAFLLEVRDESTCIPALCVIIPGARQMRAGTQDEWAGYLLGSSGNTTDQTIYLIKLSNMEGHSAPHEWVTCRFMRDVHIALIAKIEHEPDWIPDFDANCVMFDMRSIRDPKVEPAEPDHLKALGVSKR